MMEAIGQLREHGRGVWRFRYVAVITAWIVAVVGWLGVLAWPDQFEASARVFVNTSTALRPLLQGIAVDQDIDSQLNMVRESLLGRPRLERVARDADLDIKLRSPEDMDRLIARLQATIAIDAQAPRTPLRENNKNTDSVYSITYRNDHRDKALAVVRSLLNALMEDTMSGKRSGADSAQKFLVEQIKDYEKKLSESEASLAEFKQRNVGLVPGQQGDYFTRLQNEIEASKKAQTALETAMRRHDELQRQLSGGTPFASARGVGPAGAANQPGANDTASRIAETQAKLDDLLLRFTDKHPDVIALQETLSQLQARQKAEIEAIKRGDPSAAASSGFATNPVYQNIQVQLNQTNVEVAALRSELGNHQSAEADLRRMLHTAPEVEAELARLTRDYTIEKAQYTSLVERLEKAKLSEDASDTGIVQFQVISPPTADLDPVAPNRPLLLALVFAVAVSAGALAAWALAQMRPVFSHTRGLAELTGLPVLGAMSQTWSERRRAEARRGVLKLAGAMAALTIGFGALLVVYPSGSQFLHRFVSL